MDRVKVKPTAYARMTYPAPRRANGKPWTREQMAAYKLIGGWFPPGLTNYSVEGLH